MNRVIKANILLAVFAAVNIGLLIYPLGLVYVIGIYIYKFIAAALLPVMIICGIIAFAEMKYGIMPGSAMLVLGSFGSVIAVNTVNKDNERREEIYLYFSIMLWTFILIPAAVYIIIMYTDIWWMPSV